MTSRLSSAIKKEDSYTINREYICCCFASVPVFQQKTLDLTVKRLSK
jgi:hypothetical protein